eukprot:7533245-Pyramimonas_sp.AAC.1
MMMMLVMVMGGGGGRGGGGGGGERKGTWGAVSSKRGPNTTGWLGQITMHRGDFEDRSEKWLGCSGRASQEMP